MKADAVDHACLSPKDIHDLTLKKKPGVKVRGMSYVTKSLSILTRSDRGRSEEKTDGRESK